MRRRPVLKISSTSDADTFFEDRVVKCQVEGVLYSRRIVMVQVIGNCFRGFVTLVTEEITDTQRLKLSRLKGLTRNMANGVPPLVGYWHPRTLDVGPENCERRLLKKSISLIQYGSSLRADGVNETPVLTKGSSMRLRLEANGIRISSSRRYPLSPHILTSRYRLDYISVEYIMLQTRGIFTRSLRSGTPTL